MLRPVNFYLNAIFGDGTISKYYSNGKAQCNFSNTNEEIIRFKAKMINSKYYKRQQSEKAYGKKPIYVTQKSLPIIDMPKIELIRRIGLEDFFLWLCDDGSIHKRSGFMNLCSHSLSLAENIELSWHLWHYLGIETRVLPERKKDERVFFYQYIPRAQVESYIPEMEKWLYENELTSLLYKIGKVYRLDENRRAKQSEAGDTRNSEDIVNSHK
ncbi:MAG: hypothetical protein QNJ16_19720 [Rhodobacter sp.]|nr:hypothetical protein [Rhodobacter sp.]